MNDLFRSDRRMVLVAMGGNALIRAGQSGTISEQERNADQLVSCLMSLVRRDDNLVVTHGNGPQVGIQMIRHENSREACPPMPLDVLVAETQGNMGYFLQQAFLNHVRHEAIPRYVTTVMTQVIVDRNDPAFKTPNKPVGRFLSAEQAQDRIERYDWKMVEDAGRGWRRVVPSPKPLKVIQRHVIRHAALEGVIVITCGGGGIPVWIKEDGDYEGIEAVIDKDLSSSMLATQVRAEELIILMPEPRVYINFGKPDQRALGRVALSELRGYQQQGHFPPGNMGPKAEAVINFLENGGRHAIITSAEQIDAALEGREGTHFYPDDKGNARL
ncbi:MAG: carbamate kinase [Candidatus Alcyoniella australis]|nr:carbamate kinase [Candidatus Alcyoniella australis]